MYTNLVHKGDDSPSAIALNKLAILGYPARQVGDSGKWCDNEYPTTVSGQNEKFYKNYPAGTGNTFK